MYVATKDGVKINGWFIPYNNATYTLLFSHGNAGNIAHRLDKIVMLHKMGLNIFIFDYRGYGNSQGKPSEKGLYLDAETAYGYLLDTRNIAPEHIILYGESLGTAVAVNLARNVAVKGLILEGSFSSGKDMGRVLYPFIPRIFLPNIFDSWGKIKKIPAPKLFLHSTEDEIIPVVLARKLFSHAVEPKYLTELRGSHNNAFIESQEQYLSAIKAFVNNLEGNRS